MPNLDSGRYFVTILLPIKDGPFVKEGEMILSPVQAIRHILSVGATAQQSPVTHWIPDRKGKPVHNSANSHFAQNLRTHFTRIFVIDDVVYNGRTRRNTLIELTKTALGMRSANLLDNEQVDQLNHSFLAYVAEIDAPKGEESEFDSYFEELWLQMANKLNQLFQHCHGFEEVHNGKTFVEFMRAGQVETVMPFNDYWPEPPVLIDFWKTRKIIPAIIVALLGLALVITYSWWWLPLTIVAVLATLYQTIMSIGAKPLPMAPSSDLKSVLKSLYLQQNYIQFAIENQGTSATDLHQSFGHFLEKHRPNELDRPTQLPGTIHS